LKPENFLYETKEDSSDVKIIDFGLSKILDGGCNILFYIIAYYSKTRTTKNENQGRYPLLYLPRGTNW